MVERPSSCHPQSEGGGSLWSDAMGESELCVLLPMGMHASVDVGLLCVAAESTAGGAHQRSEAWDAAMRGDAKKPMAVGRIEGVVEDWSCERIKKLTHG
nr:unnamed protein product [Digitaria exilis]